MTDRTRDRPPPAIETSGLVKTFGDNRAVDGIDLAIPAGGIFALLGPNGAGKTTMIRILATLLRPSGGEARVLGHDVKSHPAQIRARIALTGQFASLDEDLTGMENLTLVARLHGYRREARNRAASLLEAFDLTDAARRQVKKYSGGMQRRLDIAASLVTPPQVLFLDEPTTGLDPRSRSQVWDVVRTLVAGRTTVVLTTQYLEEADQLADRIAVLDRGRLVAEGTSDELKSLIGASVFRLRVAPPHERDVVASVLGEILGEPVQAGADPAVLHLRLDDPSLAGPALTELHRRGLSVSEFALGQRSLDEVFLMLTDRSTTKEAGS
ncbi:MAG: ATP-binding cassette domain-containing protein [Propionibacteriaceae bacterium]